MNQISRCWPLLGTVVEVNVFADCSEELLLQASQQAFDCMKQVNDAMSFHDEYSELSVINRCAHQQPQTVSALTLPVLQLAVALHQHSAGLFDVTTGSCLVKDGLLPNNGLPASQVDQSQLQLFNDEVWFKQPLMIDLGGIAKGYAVDQGKTALLECLGTHLIQANINAGGDLWVHDWQNFEVMIPDRNKQLHKTQMLDQCLATSSGYYLSQASRIYHPHSQQPVELPATVSVFAESCMVADAMTKLAALLPVNHQLFETYNAQVVMT